ncbi:MAG: hypothetical protein LBS71_00455, partial [Puniceicoccales bacterium]|nr:hypothetical protein [Puniceicoccales bacterium]
MQFQFSVEELRNMVHPQCIFGHFNGTISNIASLQGAKEGSLSFLANPQYTTDVAESKASLLLLPKDFKFFPHDNQIIFFCEDPSIALAKICQHIETIYTDATTFTIHPSAIIHPSAQIASNVSIGMHVVIEEDVKINQNTIIGA